MLQYVNQIFLNSKLYRGVLTILLVVILMNILSCTSNDTNIATQEVLKFRENVQAGQLKIIFQESSKSLQNVTAENEFISYLAENQQDIGQAEKFSLQTWRVSYSGQQKYITLLYSADENSKVIKSEEFVFVWENNRYRLYGYTVIDK